MRQVIESTEAEHAASIHPFVNAIKAPGWTEVQRSPGYGLMIWAGRRWKSPAGLIAVCTVDELEGAEWVHLSVSRKARTPSYEDLLMVRRTFLGEEKPAYQVFPVKTEYRSLPGATVLHLWMPLGKDPFPDPNGERANTIAPPSPVR